MSTGQPGRSYASGEVEALAEGAVRHQRNGHTIELRECEWRCLQCGHWFDAATEADLFWCGDDCAGKHPGDVTGTQDEIKGWASL